MARHSDRSDLANIWRYRSSENESEIQDWSP
jgi:hypothetical protein